MSNPNIPSQFNNEQPPADTAAPYLEAANLLVDTNQSTDVDQEVNTGELVATLVNTYHPAVFQASYYVYSRVCNRQQELGRSRMDILKQHGYNMQAAQATSGAALQDIEQQQEQLSQ